LVVERLLAWGDPNVRATHRTTLEFTKEEHLTPRGDCIVAVRVNRGPLELRKEFRKAVKDENAEIELVLEVENLREVISGFGSPAITLSHPTDFVVRKSRYVCNRTLMIGADKAACDLPRPMIERLQHPDTPCKIIITVVE
jgi:hypothetical protein